MHVGLEHPERARSHCAVADNESESDDVDEQSEADSDSPDEDVGFDADDDYVDNLMDYAREHVVPEGTFTLDKYRPKVGARSPRDLDQFREFWSDYGSEYFYQDFSCKKSIENDVLGGLRGIVWRSVFKKELYDVEYLSTIDDAKLMLRMTDHLMSNSETQQDNFSISCVTY